MKKSIIEVIVGLLVIIGAVFGGVSYFATASELQVVESRLEQKILSDTILQLSQRMWQLEDRHGGPDTHRWANQRDREEYRRLQLQIEKLKKQFNYILLKQKKGRG